MGRVGKEQESPEVRELEEVHARIVFQACRYDIKNPASHLEMEMGWEQGKLRLHPLPALYPETAEWGASLHHLPVGQSFCGIQAS